MLNKKIKNRSFIFFLFSIVLILSIYIAFKTLEDNVLYFLSPTEVKEKQNLDFTKKNQNWRYG